MRATIARPEFRRDADDYRGTVMQAMRLCRLATGLDVEPWAARLGVLPAAIRAYEAGSNSPPADVWLLANEMAGRPALRLAQRWSQRAARLLADEGTLPLRVAR